MIRPERKPVHSKASLLPAQRWLFSLVPWSMPVQNEKLQSELDDKDKELTKSATSLERLKKAYEKESGARYAAEFLYATRSPPSCLVTLSLSPTLDLF